MSRDLVVRLVSSSKGAPHCTLLMHSSISMGILEVADSNLLVSCRPNVIICALNPNPSLIPLAERVNEFSHLACSLLNL